MASLQKAKKTITQPFKAVAVTNPKSFLPAKGGQTEPIINNPQAAVNNWAKANVNTFQGTKVQTQQRFTGKVGATPKGMPPKQKNRSQTGYGFK